MSDKDNKELLEKLAEAVKDKDKKDILEGLVAQDFLLDKSGDGDSDDDDKGGKDPDKGKDPEGGDDKPKAELEKKVEELQKENKALTEKTEELGKNFKAIKVALHEKRKISGLPTEEAKKTLTEKNKSAFSKIAPSIYPAGEKKD